jgi:hypothetical protein
VNGSGRTVTVTRHEWVLGNPTHWSEVDKVIEYMRVKREGLADKARCSDVQVGGQDDELIVSFIEEDDRG